MKRAFIFDVFGTCVDWRNSVAREVAAILPGVDAFAFTDAWRGEYQSAMERVRSGGRSYLALDILHLENMHLVAKRFGVQAPDQLNWAWEKLDPWPDVVAGLHALKPYGLIAPCSNGSISMMARLARHGGLPWDAIVGAEIAQDYKPKKSVYLAACHALQLPPGSVTMVAAHNDDLAAARDAGLVTAFVPRLTERGSDQSIDLEPNQDWDIIAQDFVALAQMVANAP